MSAFQRSTTKSNFELEQKTVVNCYEYEYKGKIKISAADFQRSYKNKHYLDRESRIAVYYLCQRWATRSKGIHQCCPPHK